MKAGHDPPPDAVLDRDRLGVHPDVDHTDTTPPDEQDTEELPEVPDHRDEGQDDSEGDEGGLTSRRGLTRASTAPVTGIASTAPAAGPNSANPSSWEDRCSGALMAGMRVAQLADIAPSRKNTATTGARPPHHLSALSTGAVSDREDLDTAIP